MKSYLQLQTLFESIKNKNDLLINADNVLDAKSTAILGINAAIALGYAGLVLKYIEGFKYAIGLIGLFFLLVSSVLLLVITWPTKYFTVSVNISKHKEYLKKPEKDLYLQLISDAQGAFTKNSNKVIEKMWFYRIAISLLFIVTILFIIII